MTTKNIEKKKYYITTPIYYPSGNWHLGHCYTTVICDALARFKRMDGYDVFFLTGTDEHGQKIELRAKEKGVSPKSFVDGLVASIQELWKLLDVRYDKFIRTTDEYHEKAVQKIFTQLYEQGDIYKSEYEGWYCNPCESYWTESQLVDGKCPDCGREVVRAKEECYFFRLSKYQDRLVQLYEQNPEFLQPKSRLNEMLNNFIRPGLQDLAVSRSTFSWGIPVPFDPKHVIYVWIDALTNYITALGYGSDDTTLYDKFWPADLHMVGKEIVRFHTIIWPAILMALGLPQPKQVFGHGWLLIGNDKMSKSKGNVVDPFVLVNRYGLDAVRYFLLREIPFGNDGVYTNEALLNRINADLANSLGNLVSRTAAMILQNFGTVPAPHEATDLDRELEELCLSTLEKVRTDLDALSAPDALADIFKIVNRANKYIDETMPWALAKDPAQKDRLATVLYYLAESIRFVAVLLKPFLENTSQKIFDVFGLGEVPQNFDSLAMFGGLPAGSVVTKGAGLFPRIDVKKELKELDLLQEEQQKAQAAVSAAAPQKEEPIPAEEITIDEFERVKLCTAKVLDCVKVPKSSKLLQLTLEVGDETRTVVSGIAKSYEPEYLIGKTVVIVKNLKPAKLMGIESRGMVLCGEEDGKIIFVTPEKEMKHSGSEIR